MVSALYLFTIYVSSTSLLNVQLQRLTTTHNTLSLPLSTSCHLLPPPPLFLTTTWHLKQCDCQGLLWTTTTTAGHITVSSFTFFIFLTYFFLLLGMYNATPTVNVYKGRLLRHQATVRGVFFFLKFFLLLLLGTNNYTVNSTVTSPGHGERTVGGVFTMSRSSCAVAWDITQ